MFAGLQWHLHCAVQFGTRCKVPKGIYEELHMLLLMSLVRRGDIASFYKELSNTAMESPDREKFFQHALENSICTICRSNAPGSSSSTDTFANQTALLVDLLNAVHPTLLQTGLRAYLRQLCL